MSEHFSIEEVCYSEVALRRGIENTPKRLDVYDSLVFTMANMEVVRLLLDSNPIHISSGYRSEKLNTAVGGSQSSQHMKGEAVDFTCSGYGSPAKICETLVSSGISYDQLILEGNWVHISFVQSNPRRQELTANFSSGRAIYTNGIIA